MKNITFNLANTNLINLKKIDYINDTTYVHKQNQEQKRLLHFALMKFIKTQYNKRSDILIKNSKLKESFPKFNNLNLLPYLKKKIHQKEYEKKPYFSTYYKATGFSDNKNYYSKTNNINEYNSKTNTLHAQQTSNKKTEIKDKKRYKNRIKSSFAFDASKYRKILGDSTDRNKIFNNNTTLGKDIKKNSKNIIHLMKNTNFNIYNFNILPFKRKNSSKSHYNENLNEDDINNEKTNFDTPNRESALNYKNKLNSFISEINNRKLMNYINDISNNAEVHKQDITFGKTYKKFDKIFNGKNKNNLHKNLTYREDKKDSKLINTSPEKNHSKINIKKNLETNGNKSADKNIIANYIKLIYENKKISSTESKKETTNNIQNINIKKYKFNLKQAKNDCNNFYKSKFNYNEIKNSKEGSKNTHSEKKKPSINIKKMEILDKLCINTKYGKTNQCNIKLAHNCPISFNRVVSNRKNNNNDIIDLI